MLLTLLDSAGICCTLENHLTLHLDALVYARYARNKIMSTLTNSESSFCCFESGHALLIKHTNTYTGVRARGDGGVGVTSMGHRIMRHRTTCKQDEGA